MQYRRIEIDLSEARENEPVDLGGHFNSFIIVRKDEDFEFKINSIKADTLYSSELQGFQGDGVFRSLYITNRANEGKTAVLVVF